ncbi:xylose isomerase [Zobellella endophytica]|uniref:Xylose isomerase n=1 Tax=Zobellella endophytica TaxID=2116700 RepID=A0A2P7RAP0_9GAMM|nr:TIM barrel protein [Zobellella endophytica]PSJ47297.1 xylose isomerase [Zobellella endophytica]
MSRLTPTFSLNHMTAPKLSAFELLDTARALGLKAVELRNDVADNSVSELDHARAIGAKAHELGIEILSINALYPFNIWNEERAAQAEKLAGLAAACGATGLVLCPLNDGSFQGSDAASLEQALHGLKPILEQHGLKGFVEPLGFPVSSLRLKKDAVAAIQAVGGEDRFALVHDTFHHMVAGETEFFPEFTGLVHISGVEDTTIGYEQMLDAHRVLVGPADRLHNLTQIKTLLGQGYQGYFSFEPFAKEVCELDEPVPAVQASMNFIAEGVQG